MRMNIIAVAVVASTFLITRSHAACDGNNCCYNYDCGGSRYCSGGGGVACKCKTEWFKSAWGYGGCASKKSNGQVAGGWDYTKLGYDYTICRAGDGRCNYCGLGRLSDNSKCSEDADCSTESFCNFNAAGTSAGCTGKCLRKYADGQKCPTTLHSGGVDSSCLSNKCLVLLAHHPTKRTSYCQPKLGYGGSTHGSNVDQGCTQDIDCTLKTVPKASAGMWCNGGSATTIGKCAACPGYCGANSGCNACNNDPAAMSCGRSSLGQKALCAVKVIGEAALKAVKFFFDCMGMDMATCATNVVEQIATCASGGSCDITFGYPDCFTISTPMNINQRREVASPPFMQHGRRALQAPMSPSKTPDLIGTQTAESESVTGIEYHPGPEVHMTHTHANTWDLGEEHEGQRRGKRRKAVKGINTSGSLKVTGGFGITVNPKHGTATFAVTVEATFDGVLSIDATTTKSWEQNRAIGKEVQLLQKTMMVGKFPCVVTITVEPYLWIEAEAQASFNGAITVNKKEKVTGSIAMDTNAKSLTPVIEWDSTPPAFSVSATGQFNAHFVSRVGPKFKLSFNSVPVYFDAALALKATLNVAVENSGTASVCVSGSVAVGASLDWRTNVKFAVDPVQAAYDACILLVNIAVGNPLLKANECLANTFGAGIDLEKAGYDICSNIQSDLFSEAKATTCYGTDIVLGDLNNWETIPLKSEKVTLSNLCTGGKSDQMTIKATTAGILNGKCGEAPSSYGSYLMSTQKNQQVSSSSKIAMPFIMTSMFALLSTSMVLGA